MSAGDQRGGDHDRLRDVSLRRARPDRTLRMVLDDLGLKIWLAGPADRAVLAWCRGCLDEAWTAEIGSRVDDLLSGRVQAIPGEEVFARIDARLAEREAARNA